jgi:hypothetical protein
LEIKRRDLYRSIRHLHDAMETEAGSDPTSASGGNGRLRTGPSRRLQLLSNRSLLTSAGAAPSTHKLSSNPSVRALAKATHASSRRLPASGTSGEVLVGSGSGSGAATPASPASPQAMRPSTTVNPLLAAGAVVGQRRTPAPLTLSYGNAGQDAATGVDDGVGMAGGDMKALPRGSAATNVYPAMMSPGSGSRVSGVGSPVGVPQFFVPVMGQAGGMAVGGAGPGYMSPGPGHHRGGSGAAGSGYAPTNYGPYRGSLTPQAAAQMGYSGGGAYPRMSVAGGGYIQVSTVSFRF